MPEAHQKRQNVAKKCLLFFAICLVATNVVACKAGIRNEEKQVHNVKKEKHKKKEEKTLFVYMAISREAEARKPNELFKKKTGISIKYISKSTGEIFKLIEAQRVDPIASAIYGGPLPFYMEAKKKGLLIPYKSLYSAQIPRRFRDPQNYWAGIYTGIIGFATNTKVVKNPPKSWKDLLKKEYKGKISIANPNTSGTGYVVLATLVQLMGEKKAFDYMKKLHKQIFQYASSGGASPKLVKLGIVGIVVCFVHDALAVREKGDPLVITFPKEGTGWEIGAVAIVKNAPQLDYAKKFIDFSLSSEVQSIKSEENMVPRFPTNPKARMPLTALQLKKVKLINFDFKWAGKKREYLVTKWNTEIMRNK